MHSGSKLGKATCLNRASVTTSVLRSHQLANYLNTRHYYVVGTTIKIEMLFSPTINGNDERLY